MEAVTITLFLQQGDGKSLRTAQISGWTGMAVAAPRTQMNELLGRKDLKGRVGVYILLGGEELVSGLPRAYVGEAEKVDERLKQHKTEEWTSAIVFVAKDDNFTKACAKYLEKKLYDRAHQAGRCHFKQNQPGGSTLPEHEQENMEAFFRRIRQLLPVLGSDLLEPKAPGLGKQSGGVLLCRAKGAEARGYRTATGFVIL